MTDSKITPVASSPLSGAVPAAAQKPGAPSPGPLTNAQTAQVLLQNAVVRDAPQELRALPQNLRLAGRVISSNPARGEIRIATEKGEITLQSSASLSPDTDVSIDLHMQGGRELATIVLQRAPAQNMPAAPEVPAAAPPATETPPLRGGDSVVAIRIPEEAQQSPPAPPPSEGLSRAAAIIESLGPADFSSLPKPLPVPAAIAAQIAAAPDIEEALRQLPQGQQQAILDYLARPDVAAKLQAILPPALLDGAGEIIDQNMTDIVNAQVSTKLAPETAQSQAPAQAQAPKAQNPPATAPSAALRSLMPLLEALQSPGNTPGLSPKMQMPPAGLPFADQMPENMFEVNILSVSPPGTALPPALPGQTAVEPLPAGQAQGVVESITQTGLPVVRAGGDLFILKTQSPIEPGSMIIFTAAPLSARDVMSALAAKLTPAPWAGANINTETGFQPLLGDDWPALQAALQNLAGTRAETALRNTIPSATARLVPTTLFFLAALRAGDIGSWLGANALQMLKAGGKQDLIDRLSGDFGKIAAGAKEALPGDWRGISIPLLQDEQISQMQLYLRHQQVDDEHGDSAEGEKTVTTRFLLNLHLSRMGEMQLDGLMKKQRLDLILRSRDALPGYMRQELMQSFATGLAQTGLEGGISFQAKLQGWVTVDLPHQGTVV